MLYAPCLTNGKLFRKGEPIRNLSMFWNRRLGRSAEYRRSRAYQARVSERTRYDYERLMLAVDRRRAKGG